MELTDWYGDDIKPVRMGWFEGIFFDAGWAYEWRIWWDSARWLTGPGGWALLDQNITWRGQTEQTK